MLSLLIAAEPLPPRLQDHPLTRDWGRYRNCHIEPDWLLLYKIDGNDLILARTGTHASESRAAFAVWSFGSRGVRRINILAVSCGGFRPLMMAMVMSGQSSHGAC